MKNHYKLQLICRAIDFNWGSINMVYCENKQCFQKFGLKWWLTSIDVKEIILNPEFIKKFKTYYIENITYHYSSRERIEDNYMYNIFYNIYNPIEYLFNLLNLEEYEKNN